MNVEVVIDSTDIVTRMFKGSVIQDAELIGDNYEGMFCSAAGSFAVKVPKKRCKVIKKRKLKRYL